MTSEEIIHILRDKKATITLSGLRSRWLYLIRRRFCSRIYSLGQVTRCFLARPGRRPSFI